MRASCKKYSPRKSIMIDLIQTDGSGRDVTVIVLMRGNKKLLLVVLQRITAISQVLTAYSNPHRSAASFCKSFLLKEENWTRARASKRTEENQLGPYAESVLRVLSIPLVRARVRPERLLPLLFASTCAPSGNCGWITGAHSDPVHARRPAQARFRNPISAKVEIGQVKSIAYFIPL